MAHTTRADQGTMQGFTGSWTAQASLILLEVQRQPILPSLVLGADITSEGKRVLFRIAVSYFTWKQAAKKQFFTH